MKAIVDRDTCTGCELCAQTCPDVFAMDAESLAKTIADPVPQDQADCAVEAAEGCPVAAISIK
ncbi:MAG: ferredoxin [Chitinivibrionales bacterium]|nr:ferredoxin [Chitinivibrionales bacterium]